MSKTRFTATNNLIDTLARRERNLSWLARKIGVSPQLMWFVSRRERTLSAEKAHAAALILGEPVDWLFSSTDVSKNIALVTAEAAVA